MVDAWLLDRCLDSLFQNFYSDAKKRWTSVTTHRIKRSERRIHLSFVSSESDANKRGRDEGQRNIVDLEATNEFNLQMLLHRTNDRFKTYKYKIKFSI